MNVKTREAASATSMRRVARNAYFGSTLAESEISGCWRAAGPSRRMIATICNTPTKSCDFETADAISWLAMLRCNGPQFGSVKELVKHAADRLNLPL